ncbi:MAG: 50S ribosomal protein L6 [Candidatus Methanofastidiosia archaeon]|jgi:large subunit ribosomal protein L6
MEEVEITVPDHVKVDVKGKEVTVTGEKGSITRLFKAPSVSIEQGTGCIVMSTPSIRKKEVAILKAVYSRISNMIAGVQNGYEYKLKIYYAHFPMNVKVEENRIKIDNFLGEKHPRYANIVGDTKVNIANDVVTVTGIDKENVGQTAANLEQATRIKEKDPRVFQDGIYLFEKNGVRLR